MKETQNVVLDDAIPGRSNHHPLHNDSNSHASTYRRLLTYTIERSLISWIVPGLSQDIPCRAKILEIAIFAKHHRSPLRTRTILLLLRLSLKANLRNPPFTGNTSTPANPFRQSRNRSRTTARPDIYPNRTRKIHSQSQKKVPARRTDSPPISTSRRVACISRRPAHDRLLRVDYASPRTISPPVVSLLSYWRSTSFIATFLRPIESRAS